MVAQRSAENYQVGSSVPQVKPLSADPLRWTLSGSRGSYSWQLKIPEMSGDLSYQVAVHDLRHSSMPVGCSCAQLVTT